MANQAPSPELKANLNHQRKAALIGGGAIDHAGRVRVRRLDSFDITSTIFGGLEGVPKLFMEEKLGKEAVWNSDAAAAVDAAYGAFDEERPAPVGAGDRSTPDPLHDRRVRLQHGACRWHLS